MVQRKLEVNEINMVFGKLPRRRKHSFSLTSFFLVRMSIKAVKEHINSGVALTKRHGSDEV
ncbi:unnamed protein product, partial [Brugia timori]|uniref:Transposase n=1 Tax=Brugia timori TaxID=42155 RepID=A0A0R3R623_9BILA